VLALWNLLPVGGPLAHLDLVAWMTGPRRDLDGQSPVEYLRDHGLDAALERAAGQVRRRAAA
jgi:hypothetical protein